MAGIYIHIPFCRRKCHYCNFYSIASQKYMKELLETLPEELFLRRNYLGKNSTIQTIYFGGGTPSHVPVTYIKQLIEIVRSTFPVVPDPEITLEANPDDLTPDLLLQYKEAGINRLSIGVQSFFDEDLLYLNRTHSAARAEESIRDARLAGFDNLSIDLIYGIPTLTDERWMANLDKAFSLGIPHISAYSLTVEPKTALDLLIKKHTLQAPEEERAIGHFRLLVAKLREQGFEHYEISNFCKPGFYSKHNCQYWNGQAYLGLGPSAHSFDGHSRQWNVANIIQYIDQIRHNDRWFEMEELTPEQQYNEFVMVNLRTMWGVSLRALQEKFGETRAESFVAGAAAFIDEGKMMTKDGVYFLTDDGKLFADGIASALFV
jgi:oxygen-independent coproporphyrinogen III oxidase